MQGTLDEANATSVYFDPEIGLWVYRMHAIGMCERALLGFRLGITPYDWPEFVRRGMDEGSLHEDQVLRKLEAEGWHIWPGTRQLRKEIRVGTHAVIRGHVECIAEHDDYGVRVIEVKATSDSLFREITRKVWDFPLGAEYAMQLSGNMQAHGLLGYFAVKNRNNGKLWKLPVDEPPANFAEAKAKVLRIESMVRKGTSPRAVPCPTPERYPCPMAHLHTVKKVVGENGAIEVQAAAVSDVPAEYIATVEAFAATIREAKDREAAAQAAYKEAKQSLMEFLGERREAITTPRFRVSPVYPRPQTRVDMEKVREAGIDLSAFEVPIDVQPWVKVTVLDEEKSEGRGGSDA